MKPLLDFSYSLTGGILMLLYTLFLIQFVCMLLAWEKGAERFWLYSLLLLLVTGTSLIFLRVFNEREELGFFPSRIHRLPWMEQLPLWGILLYLMTLAFVSVWLLQQVIRYWRASPGRYAIKESFDNLPTGLCFSTKEGFVLLANRKMEWLCFALTGQDLQDVGEFWEQITKHGPNIYAQPLTYGTQPCFRLENQEIWTFHRDFLDNEGMQVIQISAVNISQLYQLSQELADNSRRLADLNRRLKQYGENMDSYVRSKELLETKVRIHREMGQALMASRACLLQKIPDLSEEDIIKRWEAVILLLKKEAEPPQKQDGWNQFQKAAREAGVQVLQTGTLPTDSAQREYLLMAAVEALTNAVRHGGADQLCISIAKDTVFFSNNGKNPSGPITEGGGLSALRIRLKEAGGSMQIKTSPSFCLSVKLPPQGGKHDTYTGFNRRR